MAYLTPITQAQLRSIFVNEYQADAAQPADDGPGSQFGALANATSALATQVEENVEYALGVSRLATSYGEDVDSFTSVFGVPRLGATAATTSVTIAINSVSSAPLTWVQGTIVTRSDGTQYTLGADATIAAGQTSVNAPATCVTAGSVGNCNAGEINAFYTGAGAPPAPAATVTNPQPVTNGVDAESDDDLKGRFALAISGEQSGTQNAILAAVASIQTGLTYSFGDRLDQNGNVQSSYFTVVVNTIGQSGGPSVDLLASATAAVESKRAAGINYAVIGPTLVPVTSAATLVLQTGADPTATIAAATAANAAWLNGIGLDPGGAPTTASLARLYALLLTVPGVKDVTGATLNGAAADVNAAFANQIVAAAPNFTVS